MLLHKYYKERNVNTQRTCLSLFIRPFIRWLNAKQIVALQVQRAALKNRRSQHTVEYSGNRKQHLKCFLCRLNVKPAADLLAEYFIGRSKACIGLECWVSRRRESADVYVSCSIQYKRSSSRVNINLVIQRNHMHLSQDALLKTNKSNSQECTTLQKE